MRWLLTTSIRVARTELERDLEVVDARLADSPAVPLGDEQVFEAEGPEDLPARLRGRTSCVIEAYPDSDVEAF